LLQGYGRPMHSTKNTGNTTGKTSAPDGKAGKTEFDGYAENYDDALNKSIGFSGHDSSFFDERKIKEIYEYLKPQGIAEKPFRFLNFGCGIGKSEKYIVRYFPAAAIYSVDTSQASIAIARANNRERDNITFSTFDGYSLPFETEFDVVLAANVLHHIPLSEHVAVLKHIFLKMSVSGHLFLFEHNPFNPLTLKVVKSCAFDKNATLLNPFYSDSLLRASGFLRRSIRFIHFFPKQLAFLMPLERLLRKVPLGAQYYFIACKQER